MHDRTPDKLIKQAADTPDRVRPARLKNALAAAAPMPREFAWVGALAIILGLSAALIFGRLTTGHDWGDDFASYIDQARSILASDVDGFIQRNAFTIHSSSAQIGPVAYPWGYPLLLAAIYPACGLDIFCLKLLNIPVYLFFLVALFLLLRRHLNNAETLLVVLLFAVNPHLLDFQNNVLSDLPFMAFSTFGLWLVDRALVDEQAKKSPGHYILLGAALFAAFYMRTTGILLAATLFAGQAIQVATRLWKTRRLSIEPVNALPNLVFLGLYFLSNSLLTEATGSYLSQLSITWEAIAHNLGYYRLRAFNFFNSLPGFESLSWILLILAAVGLLVNAREKYPFALYALGTAAVYILWPFTSPRFLYGITPLIVLFAYLPIRAAARLVFKRTAWMGYAAPMAVLLATGLIFSLGAAQSVRDNLARQRVFESGPFTQTSVALFAFIRENTPAESKIIFFKPRAMSLLTNRASLMISDCTALDLGDYVALRKGFSYHQVEPEQAGRCNPNITLLPVFENSAFIVYQITP